MSASSASRDSFDQVTSQVVTCRLCPRLVEWREKVATEKRAAFADEDYWGRPVPSFGDRRARILVAGLAPAAHGGNRTGRVFTGDRSGEWLFASLYRCGLANQPISSDKDDGLRLLDVFVAAAVRCAPPANKPTPQERDRCLPYLQREIALLSRLRVIVALGSFAWDAVLRVLAARGEQVPRPRPRFGHLEDARIGRYELLGSYHPSQQNTFTGKLTEEMLDAVFLESKARTGA